MKVEMQSGEGRSEGDDNIVNSMILMIKIIEKWSRL
jgi:hypothetical protein